MNGVRTRISKLHSEGIIDFLYADRPAATTYYVFLSKNAHGDSVDQKVPEARIGEVLSEIESAAKLHEHRFEV